MLRIRMQTGVGEYASKGTLWSLNHILKTEGVFGMFKGNALTCVKITPFSAVEFYAYEVYKKKLFPGKTKKELGYGAKLLCGSLTGMTAQLTTYPVDLIKTYITIGLASGKERMTVTE